MPKSDVCKGHARFWGILKVKRNCEIVSEQAMFKESQRRVSGAVGVGGGYIVHGGKAVFGMPAFAVFPWAGIYPFA